ncbi:MAG TPA: haloacid dehalogenase [Trebonia sp.]|jgi:phosphonatase-like hydrolase|nr:haloacid dehalogenase [Trebonia sp.]
MVSPAVSLVCYDLASLVIDTAVVERAFAEAIATQGIVTGTEAYVRSMVRFDRGRGRSPVDILRDLFGSDESRVQAASLAFDKSFNSAAERFGVTASPETLPPLDKVAACGIRVCLLTSLSRAASGTVLDWVSCHVPADLVLCADDAPRGFPMPDLMLTAMLRLGTPDVREIAVVSATGSGLLAGYRAGAGLVIGVADSPQQVPSMRDAGATVVLDDVAALPELLVAATSA